VRVAHAWDDEVPAWDDEAPLTDAEERDVGELAQIMTGTPTPTKKLIEKRRTDPRFKELAERVRALPARKRMFLNCMTACQMIPAKAIKALDKLLQPAGVRADRSAAYRWLRDPEYRDLIALYSDLALEVHGLNNPTTTLLRIDEVYEEAMTPQPIVNRKTGAVVGYKKDLSSALKATDQLGRAQKLFRAEDEKSQRVTVVLDFSGEKPAGDAESEVIDGEFSER
jgi:hypothetical protein